MGISTYLANEILDHTLRGETYTPPMTVYLALYSESPGGDNSGSELSGNGYARKAITFDAAASGATDNSGLVTFNTATGSDWTSSTHWGILDAASSGNLMYFGPWDTAKIAQVGQTLSVAIGDLDASF